jgi:hypothetical protein
MMPQRKFQALRAADALGEEYVVGQACQVEIFREQERDEDRHGKSHSPAGRSGGHSACQLGGASQPCCQMGLGQCCDGAACSRPVCSISTLIGGPVGG